MLCRRCANFALPLLSEPSYPVHCWRNAIFAKPSLSRAIIGQP